VLHNALHPLPDHGAVLNLGEGLLAADLPTNTLSAAVLVGVVVLMVVLVGAHHTLLLSYHNGDLQ
jgi:hypothetical protein